MACVETRTVNFGVWDARGREIGCRYVIEEIAWEGPSESRGRGSYLFRPQATRDGADYGAFPVRACKYFDTLAAAQAHAEIYIKSARQRASKAHGAEGGV